MSESFFLSNRVTQVGEQFNGSVWEEPRREIRDWVKTNGSVTIIASPAFGSQPDDLGQSVQYRVIGENSVAVPTHLFKIVLDNPFPQTPKALGFLMENRQYRDDETYHDHLEGIDEIERLTGIDFLSGLDNALEAEVERAPASVVWWNIDSPN